MTRTETPTPLNPPGEKTVGKPSRSRSSKQDKWSELYRKRILVVEDEALQAINLAQMIVALGADVTGIATSVQGALAELSIKEFDCVTLDINLDGFFSLGIVKGLRDMGIPFVICTGYAHALSGLEGGPIVSKPFTERRLAEALTSALKGRAERSPA
jgi:CheY-like chemotaxis protein